MKDDPKADTDQEDTTNDEPQPKAEGEVNDSGLSHGEFTDKDGKTLSLP